MKLPLPRLESLEYLNSYASQSTDLKVDDIPISDQDDWQMTEQGINRKDGKFFSVGMYRIQKGEATWSQPLVQCATYPNGYIILLQDTHGNILLRLRDEPGLPSKIWGPTFQASVHNSQVLEVIKEFTGLDEDALQETLAPVHADGDRYHNKLNFVGTLRTDHPHDLPGCVWVSRETLLEVRSMGILSEHLLTTMAFL